MLTTFWLQGMSPAEIARLASYEAYEWKNEDDLAAFLDKAEVSMSVNKGIVQKVHRAGFSRKIPRNLPLSD
jgi:hypothetical protein